ncbi:MAG: NAD(P)-dependent oxidoreductase [Streptomycetaceae bacterium]|nr:MAG: NAD(P)-dependent oxidoreductase [Streptomycetaceae bacterium]
MAKVSFIGLGIMGSGIVANLVKAGHDVSVWNRSESKYADIKKVGAKTVSNPAQLLPDADFLLYCLADDVAVVALFLKGPKLASKVEKSTIVIDLSTIDPATSAAERKVYESRGIAFLDAPVFGTKGEARDGGLWIVIGGAEDVYKKSLPVLEPISETLHYMGEGGNGTKMKLVGNLLVASQIISIGEALTLAKKAGLNLTKVLEVTAVADFKTPIYAGVGASVIQDNYEVNFPLKLMLKDARLIQAFAKRVNSPVSIAVTTEELAQEGVDDGMGELNASAIVKVISNRAGVDLSE